MIDHIVLAVLILLTISLLFRNWAAGAAAACAWAVSREITQAEYRWIEHYGSGLRANMPWWGGLDYRVWARLDPWLDWLVPSLVAVGILFLVNSRAFQRDQAPTGNVDIG
ncbi:MAG: hypothetical protein ACR2FK_01790 [Sphingomicrobium sp.]